MVTRSKSRRVDPATYAKNVLRSAGYIASTTIKGVNPTLTSFVSDNASAAKDMYKAAKDYKTTIRTKMNSILGDNGAKGIKQIKGNIIDDLKTGKFYNPEREEKAINKIAESWGISFDFNDFDFDIDEKDVEGNTPSTSDAATTSAVLTIGDKIAFTQSKAADISSSKIVSGARSNTRASMAHNERLFGQLNSSLAVINSSIMNLHADLAAPLNSHITNSANFYATATTELAKQTSYLEDIHRMVKERFYPAPTSGFGSKKEKTPWESIMGGELPDLRAWGSHAKKKAIEQSGLDMITGMLNPEMMDMFINGGMGSPISFIVTTILQNKIQNGPTGKALDKTVNILKDGFTKFAADISAYNKRAKGKGILGKLASIFDITPSGKKNMEFGNYNKGRADWTGKDSRALQVVIPTQLAKILAALTGKEAEIYDYNTGRFVKSRTIVNKFKAARNENIGRASYSLKNDVLNDFISTDRERNAGTNVHSYTMNSRATRNLAKDYDTFISLLTIKNIDISQFKHKGDIVKFCRSMGWIGTGSGNYILSYNNIKAIDDTIFRRNTGSGRLVSAVYAGRIADSNFISEAPDTAFGTLANGSGLANAHRNNVTNIFSNLVDDMGRNVWFYLQSYYDQLRSIAGNNRDRSSNRQYTNRAQSRGSSVDRIITSPRRRERHTRGISLSSISGDTSDAAAAPEEDEDPEGRYEYNPITGRYEAPRASSRSTRERQEKSSIFSRGIDRINEFLDNALFGNLSESIKERIADEGGLIGFIKNIPQHIGEAVSSAIDKAKAYASDKLEKFKESDFGRNYIGNMKSMVKNYASNTFDYTKDKASNIYKWATGKNAPWAAEVTGAYKGGYVKKSGMISVSEGELIIPANKNPYYTGHMGDAARKSIERTNYNKWLKDGGSEDDFYGFFKNGGRVRMTKLTDKEKDNIRNMAYDGMTAEEIAKKLKKNVAQIRDFLNNDYRKYKVEETVDNAKEAVSGAKDKFASSKFGKKASEYASKAAEYVGKGINYVFGSESAYSNIKNTVNETMKAAKVDLPKTMAAGTLGALIGAAATGSGLGLLGGFAIGAGKIILDNSSSLSEKLFGKFDGKEWVGGKLPSNVTKFIKERLPSVGKAAGAGAILGTLGIAPGGIYGGLILGAGLEMVSTTTKFKDIMFGVEDVNGNRNGGIMGAIKTNAVDPLIRFVQNGIKNVGDYVKKNFLTPMSKIFDPMKDWIKGKARRTMDSIVDSAKEVVKRTVGERFNALFKPVAGAVGKAGRTVLGAAGAVASAPFKAVGKAGEALERHNIRMGYSSKSAQERMKYEGQQVGIRGAIGRLTGNKSLGALKNTAYTKWASTASDQDILDASTYINGATDIKRSIMTKRQNLANLITASMVNGGMSNPKEVKAIKKLFNTNKVVKDNDFSEVIAGVQNLSDDVMGAETKAKVIEKINEYQANIQNDFDRRETFDSDRDAFFRKIGLTNPNQIAKFTKNARVQSRIDAANIRKKSSKTDSDDIEKAKQADDASKRLKEQEKENPMGAHLNSTVDTIKDIVAGIASKIGVIDKDVPKASNSDEDKVESSPVEKVLPTSSKSSNTFNRNDEAEEGAEKTVFDGNGRAIKYVYTKGNWEPDNNDPGTNEIMDQEEEDRSLRNKFFSMFVSGGILSSLKGLFSPSSKEEGEKTSIWSKIGEILTNTIGSNGILGKIFTAIGGKAGIGSLIKGLIPAAGAAAGAFVLSKVGEKSAGTGKDSGMYKGADAEARKEEVAKSGFFSKVGLGMDSIENTIRGRDTTTYNEDDFVSQYMSDSLVNRMGKNALLSFSPSYAKKAGSVIGNTLGKIPVVGKSLAFPLDASTKLQSTASKVANSKLGTTFSTKLSQITENLGKKISSTSLGSKIVNNAKSIGTSISTKASNIANGISSKTTNVFGSIKNKIDDTISSKNGAKAVSEIVSKVKSVISKVFNTLSEKLGLKSAESAIDDVAEQAAETIAKKGGSKLASGIAKIVPIIGVIFIVNAITEGFQAAKAKSILGILDEPTIPQRLLAAACNGINEAIPGIGGLIPTETLFSIIYTALELLGLDFGKLSDQRAEAKAKVEAYNNENGTTYNIEEYIHNVLGEYTIQQKIGKVVSSVGNAIVSGAKKVGSTIVSGAKAIGNGIASLFGGGTSNSDDSAQDSKFNNSFNRNDRLLNKKTTTVSSNNRFDYSSTISGGYSKISNTWNNTTNNKSESSSSMTGGSSGIPIHTVQKGNFRKFGGTTIDKNGCGPAAASTVLKAYGINSNINDAADYAENGGYVAGNSGVGTRASYFKDIFSKNGIKSSYTDDKSKINDAISNGSPTVLLGQDKNNKSKTNSPFGPNPHYVVARGTDKNGNIVVDDPELGYPALYKKSILKNTKLGVTTGGSSGADGLVSGFFGGIFGKVSESLGNTAAGKIAKFIFGGANDESSEDGNSDNTSSSGSSYSGTYTGDSPFEIATSVPKSSDPYVKYYNNSKNGGISQCVSGKPTDSVANVLSNCVGWASGRFNHIYSLLTGYSGIKYPKLNCNAERFIEAAQGYGLTVSQSPQPGAIMVWQKGATLNGSDGAGHVAVVEKVISDTEVMTSESGYNSYKFKNSTRKKGNGNWGISSPYKFRGFILNPAVEALVKTQSLTADESKKAIWKYMKNAGFTEKAIAGAMGCWERESGNKADRVEGDYLGQYPGHNTVLATPKSISDWTQRLFGIYKNSDIGINENAYKASDGNYYAGIGLAQWTGPRAYNLINYAKSKNKNYRNIDTQIDFFLNGDGEFKSRPGLKDKLNSASSAEDAATIFLDGFEMYNGWHNTSTGRKQNTARRNSAAKIYNSLKGTGSGLYRKPGNDIPVIYNFTEPKRASKNLTKSYIARSRGSASNIPVATNPGTIGLDTDSKIDKIALYLSQIVSNTANNTAIPILVEVMKQSLGVISNIGNNSTSTADATTNMNNEIDLMRSKLEAIATTI